jgi:hypothetical protein
MIYETININLYLCHSKDDTPLSFLRYKLKVIKNYIKNFDNNPVSFVLLVLIKISL